ncbi:MAG TPA: M1 family metallopeptidase, partial [Bacteroidota bacterium]|nr:M1 family metallopeptidase [Bacteroidota bacterium]
MLIGSCAFASINDPRIYLYDATHYDLSLGFNFLNRTFSGTVKVTAHPLQPMTEFVLCASRKTLTIDAVSMAGKRLAFKTDSNSVIITLPQTLPADKDFEIAVEYSGKAVRQNQYDTGGLTMEVVDGLGRVATMSEPYYARTWWPCKDVPNDKATATVHITVASNLTALSNGVLVSTQRLSTASTYTWSTNYPTSTYLIAILVGNYRQFSESYTGSDGKKLPITFWVFPEDFAKARIDFGDTKNIVAYFSNTFCEYPFMNEKLGYAEVQGNMTMENQTICTIENRLLGGDKHYLPTIVHETAHQWWGDLITPENWKHSWLNEGFATYAEALYLEHTGGRSAYNDYIDNIMHTRQGQYAGSVLGQSDTSYWDAFSSRVYNKGAIVLHMLRGVMGDQKFFSAMKAYVNNPKLRYANATTDDFQRACEHETGSSLRWFFAEWVSANTDSIDRPEYSYNYSLAPVQSGFTMHLNISQTTANILVYKMPLDVLIATKSGSKSYAVTDSAANQSFT